jgi:hypothetical protein
VLASTVRRRQRRSGLRPKPNPNSLLVSLSLASLPSPAASRHPLRRSLPSPAGSRSPAPSLASLASHPRQPPSLSRQPLARSIAQLSRHRTTGRPVYAYGVPRTAPQPPGRHRRAYACWPAGLPSPPLPPQGAGPAAHRPPQCLQSPSPAVSTEHPSNGDSRAGGWIQISSTVGPSIDCLAEGAGSALPCVSCGTTSNSSCSILHPCSNAAVVAIDYFPLDGTASLLFKIFSRPKRLSSNAQPSNWNAILLPRIIHQR